MRLHSRSGVALAICLGLASAITAGCGPAARATPTRSIDPSTLYVAQVHWSPSEITALGVVPAFPRDSWVALVGEGGYVRHGRVGGASRHECDDCIGPRTSITLSIDEPQSTVFAIGPADRRLPRIALLGETPFDPSAGDAWVTTSTFDVDADGTADLERVERCTSTVTTGCEEQACTRRCAATRTIGESSVRGELCMAQTVVPVACVPHAPPPVATATQPEPEPEPTASEETTTASEAEPSDEEEVSGSRSPSTTGARRRHWGSRRRPR